MINFDDQIILENDKVLLKPIDEQDYKSFSQIAFDKSIWQFNVSKIANENELREFITNAIEDRKQNLRYTFSILDKSINQIAGSTSFGNISIKDKRLEIGATWLGKKFQGTGLNKHCKYLLLEFAFENIGFERIEFKTDILNIASRKALLKIGAKEEGVLRSHTLMHDGRRRDTIYFGILKSEWPEIKLNIFKIAKFPI